MDSPLYAADRLWPRRCAWALLLSPSLSVALVALVGQLLKQPLLASYGAGFIPMAPVTSINIMLLAAALLIALRPSAGRKTQLAAVAVAAAVSVCGAVVWLALLDARPVDRADGWIAQIAQWIAQPLAQMSPWSGALFVLAGIALIGVVVGHSGGERARRWLLLAAVLGMLIAAAALLVVVSYAADAPLFYDSVSVPVALPTAIAFCLLGAALAALAALCAPGAGSWAARLAGISVASQLQLALAAVVAAALGLGYIVDLHNDVLWSQTQSMYAHPLTVLRAIGELRGDAWQMRDSLEELARGGAPGGNAIAAQDQDAADAMAARALATVKQAYLGPRADTTALGEDWQRMLAVRAVLISARMAVPDAAATRQRLAAHGVAAARRVLDRIDVIARYASHTAERFYAEAERRNRSLDTALISILAAVLLGASVLGWRLTRQISDPVRELTAIAAQFGRGQLDARSTCRAANEFGALAANFNAMADTIQRDVRANALLTEQLRHSQTMLAAQNKELEAFSYSVSHDLRAPLRGIDGFSRILLEDCGDRLDADGRDSLNRIRAATQRMAQLIDDLLRLSRLSRSEMHLEPIDLSAMVREIGAELSAQDSSRRVTLVVAEGVMAIGDRQLLRVALTNLLANAWKFTATRTDARIEFGTQETDGRRWYFVRDNGVGFDQAYGDKLFGAFQRLHSSSEYPGTGIGLATVLRVVRRHGGSVGAVGAVDIGATFSFELDPQATEP